MGEDVTVSDAVRQRLALSLDTDGLVAAHRLASQMRGYFGVANEYVKKARENLSKAVTTIIHPQTHQPALALNPDLCQGLKLEYAVVPGADPAEAAKYLEASCDTFQIYHQIHLLFPNNTTDIANGEKSIAAHYDGKNWFTQRGRVQHIDGQPQAMIGHSIGEYVAACLAGVFTLEDALALVAARGRLIQSLPAGAMLSVPLPERELLPLLGDSLALAAVNGPALCIVSGPGAAIDALHEQLKGQGLDCRRLHTSHAFHSAMMDQIVEPFTEQVRQIRLSPPALPYISNVTGTWIAGDDALVGKRLELLKEAVPGVMRVALFVNAADLTDKAMIDLATNAARALGLTLTVIPLRDAAGIEAAFATAARDGAQTLFVSQGPFFNAHRAELAERAQRARLPAIYGFREFAFAGGMMSYGPSLPAVYQRFATLVEKIILKGEKPGNLPIEVPTRFELVINLKAANAINLDIPEAFLIRADEVIE